MVFKSMGSINRNFSPFPPNYIAVTFRPTDELWICQGPPHFIEFVRSLLGQIWPKYEHQERHCDVSEKRKRKGETQLHPILKNAVFRIPTDPFNLSPIHQSEESSESTYKFITLMVAFLYSMDYEMVSAGHFIRGTEASTCLFRYLIDHEKYENINKLVEECQLRPPISSIPLSAKHSKAVEFEFAKKMLAVGLEGWNRLYFINITHKLISDLVDEFRSVRNVKLTYFSTLLLMQTYCLRDIYN